MSNLKRKAAAPPAPGPGGPKARKTGPAPTRPPCPEGAELLFRFVASSPGPKPTGLLDALPLPRVKEVALAAGLHPSWQGVGARQRRALIAALEETRSEALLFRDSVARGASAAGRVFHQELARLRGGHRATPRSPSAAAADAGAFRAMVHTIPSGSGCFVATPLGPRILTCAHCIDRDGEDDDDEPEDRVGRFKIFVFSDGELGLARATSCIERSDAALLELVFREREGRELDCVCVAEPDSNLEHTPVICVHNPYDWDLEGEEGARPRPTGFTPFSSDRGMISGYRGGDRTDSSELGSVKHSCWTYWGTSGAPLLNRELKVVAMHNSWDPETAQRHAVALEALRILIK